MEFLEFGRIIRKRLWLVVLLVALFELGAFAYSQRQVPMYSTTTTLFLNPAAVSPLLPYQTTQSVQALANTYAEFIRTRSFADLVAKQLDEPLSQGDILRSLSTQWVRDTQFFRITATHRDPQRAQDLANSAADVLIAQNIARQQAERQQIQSQNDPAKEAERKRLTQLQQTIQEEQAYYRGKIAALQTQITNLENQPPSSANDAKLLSLREELVKYQSLSIDLLSSQTRAESSLATATDAKPTIDTAVVVDTAPLPTRPIPQKIPLYTLFVLAASLGVSLAFLLEYMDYTVKTPEELDALYGIATLGVIGVLDESEKKGGDGEHPLVTISHPRSPVAEAFRALRTNIQFASPDEPVRSLLITSAGPYEGKTSTAANLAVSLAQGGSRVILVDTDLRRPRLHRVFGVARQPGFSNLVIDPHANVEDYLYPTAVENLRVLPCGDIPPNPAELLSSPRAGYVMQQLKQHADVVIFDTPPAATVTDAVVMAPRVDAVLQVVRAGRTRRDLVAQGRAVLEKVGARVIGAVLNGVHTVDLGYYTYYYYYGYYRNGQERHSRSVVERVLHRNGKNGHHQHEKVVMNSNHGYEDE